MHCLGLGLYEHHLHHQTRLVARVMFYTLGFLPASNNTDRCTSNEHEEWCFHTRKALFELQRSIILFCKPKVSLDCLSDEVPVQVPQKYLRCEYGAVTNSTNRQRTPHLHRQTSASRVLAGSRMPR